ncbi:HNH endonuclease [Protofrankia coriariae]|uniref:HNH endonuclease n=1 Tax=Protofrankia coriariae TaxID=1562887 RepID=UPI003B84A2D5
MQPHSTGGPTSEANLLALCRRHHRAKHDGGWTVHRTNTNSDANANSDSDGDGDAVVWTAPTGRTYLSVPEPWNDPIPPTPPASTTAPAPTATPTPTPAPAITPTPASTTTKDGGSVKFAI